MFLGGYPSKIRMIFANSADANATGKHHHPQYSEEKSPAHQDRQTGQCNKTIIGSFFVFSAHFRSQLNTYSSEMINPQETAEITHMQKVKGIIVSCFFCLFVQFPCFFGQLLSFLSSNGQKSPKYSFSAILFSI